MPNPAPAGGNPINPPAAVNFTKLCKNFASLGGNNFSSKKTFVEARAWLRDTERIFGLLGLDDQQRVQLTSWQLKEEASYWWKVIELDGRNVTWDGFRERFDRKFLSQAEESVQLERFINLKQGSLLLMSASINSMSCHGLVWIW